VCINKFPLERNNKKYQLTPPPPPPSALKKFELINKKSYDSLNYSEFIVTETTSQPEL
jgi:hypothetical protein